MPRGSTMERQPLLSPVGELVPPDGPGSPPVACAGAYQDDDDAEFRFAMAGLAWLLVRAYTAAQVADLDPSDV